MAKDIKQLLKEAKLPERTVVLCLNQDLNSALETAERKLVEALAGPDMSSLNGAAHPELRAEIAAIKDAMVDSKMEFKYRAWTRNSWTKIIKENPPQEDDAADKQHGFNWDAVTAIMLRDCLVGVRTDDDDEWTKLDDEDWVMLIGDDTDENVGVLSSVQYDLLATIAWQVNRRDVDVPFLPSNSQEILNSASL